MGKYSKKPTAGQTRQKKLMITITCLAALLLAVLLVFFSCQKEEPVQADTPFIPQIDDAAGEWNGMPTEPRETQPPAPGIAVPGYPYINIPANTQQVNLPLHNPEGNPCYFTFRLVMKDTEEVLYESKQVPPGQGISSVTLNRGLEPGEHVVIIQISTNSLTDGSPMNGANMQSVLVAE